MPTDPNRDPSRDPQDHQPQADEPIPRASDDKVLEETARLAREGERELEQDPKEPKQRPV